MKSSEFNDEDFLRIGCDFFDEMELEDQKLFEARFVQLLFEDFQRGFLSESLRQVLSFAPVYAASWIHREGDKGYWSVDCIVGAGSRFTFSKTWRDLLMLVLDSKNLLMPYDYRAMLLETLGTHCDRVPLTEWVSSVTVGPSASVESFAQ